MKKKKSSINETTLFSIIPEFRHYCVWVEDGRDGLDVIIIIQLRCLSSVNTRGEASKYLTWHMRNIVLLDGL